MVQNRSPFIIPDVSLGVRIQLVQDSFFFLLQFYTKLDEALLQTVVSDQSFFF